MKLFLGGLITGMIIGAIVALLFLALFKMAGLGS